MKLRHIIPLIMAVLAAQPLCAAEGEIPVTDTPQVVRKSQLDKSASDIDNMVIVGDDTISMILPERNYGRYDRGLYNYLYVPKGSWAFGVTASYGSLNTEDVKVLSILDNVNFQGKLYSIKPSVSYFIRNNQSIGMRVNYTRGLADLASLALDFDEDMSFALHDVSYYSSTYKLGIFYRNYVGLSMEKRFSIFNEVSLDFGTGSSRFKRYYSDELYDTKTITTSANLNFSPGLCVFIQDNVAFNVSFGVFGLHFTDEKQSTNGKDEGSRVSSGANFKFNIFNIGFGLLVVI